jgi:hypothetical protein
MTEDEIHQSDPSTMVEKRAVPIRKIVLWGVLGAICGGILGYTWLGNPVSRIIKAAAIGAFSGAVQQRNDGLKAIVLWGLVGAGSFAVMMGILWLIVSNVGSGLAAGIGGAIFGAAIGSLWGYGDE